jgi:hypothetical protein
MKLIEAVKKVLGDIWPGLLIVLIASSFSFIGEKTTEQVPCIDDRGRPFVDELCNKTSYPYEAPGLAIGSIGVIITIFLGLRGIFRS